MSSNTVSKLRQPLSAFSGKPQYVRVEPLGQGNINDTWLVVDGERKFVLQRINGSVFPSPRRIIENFLRVTDHLADRLEKSSLALVCPRIVATRHGEAGFQDDDGEWWRAQTYIHQADAPRQILPGKGGERLGKVLAAFHLLTSDLDPESLYKPLPDFHVTPVYLEKYEKWRRNRHGRETADLRECFRFIEKYCDCAAVLEDAGNRGRLSVRTIHGDPKLDNIILADDGLAMGLFDLDTIGPGLIHYDLGDCLRSVCNRAGENSGSPDDVVFDIDICRDVLTGYLETAGATLSDWERYYIYDAVLAITFELGLRFVTDYLMGDVYFKVSSEGENLQRGRVQFALAASLAKQQGVIRQMTETL